MNATAEPAETFNVVSPLQGTIITVEVTAGTIVAKGDELAVIESMKMEHVITAPSAGTVASIAVDPGATVASGERLLSLELQPDAAAQTLPNAGATPTVPPPPPPPPPARSALIPPPPPPPPPGAGQSHAASQTTPYGSEGSQVPPMVRAPSLSPGASSSPDPVSAKQDVTDVTVRADLAEVIDRHDIGYDHRRPEAVDKRRRTGQRTARENVEHLIDDGTFIEYAPLVIAAQRRRRELDDLIARTPADGLVSGVGTINGDLFGEDDAQCAVLSYDYTVLAGTQGSQNHRKKDRLFEIAERQQLPVVFFTEGGGGRPGDTDGLGVAGLDCLAFAYWGALSGLVPIIGINSGYCFAGNAALLACCDVIIATENSNIGMAGPAMIEGGGLGVYDPKDIGPIETQVANGNVDIVVPDEAAAVDVAKKYLSYFQGAVSEWTAPDPTLLRSVVPENRKRVYDMRAAIDGIADIGTVLELRPDWGLGMITSFIRIEGRPLGVIANNPVHLAGAIDRDAADKSARFMQLCDAHDLPILFLCDTPGFMVGPDSEAEGMVRHAGRLFVTGSSITVPFFTIVTRKGYGLGAQAMAGGGFKQPLFTVSWPTGEFGGMGLEGYVKLGYRKELEAIEDPDEREAQFEERVERMYEHGKAVSVASHFEIDDVIDPAESRRWIMSALRSAPAPLPRHGKKRPMVDTW